MRNDKQMNYIWNRYNALRGYTAQSELQVALFLLKKTKDEFLSSSRKPTEQKAYELMLSISNSYGMKNPYPDSKTFFGTFMAMDDEDIDWEMVLASADHKEMFYIPKVLITEFEKHFNSNTKMVLIPEAEKFVPYLTDLVSRHSDCEFFITTMNSMSKVLLNEMFKEYVNVIVEQTSIYDYEFSARKFDLILVVPIFGARERRENNGDFICREYEMIAVENLLLHLNSSGVLVIVLPARITFAAGSIKDLREFIQGMYKLEEIAELPTGIFASTAIKTYMFTITTGRTEDVMIKRYDAATSNIKKNEINELILVDDTFVMLEELIEMGYWNVDHIFRMVDEDWQRYQNSSIKKEELGNVAEVFRGKAINKKDANGSIGVVNISNLSDYDIDYAGLDHIEEEERKVANYLLRDGDLLLPARGTAIRIAIFQEQKYPCIASSNIIVIRPNEKLLLGTYLKVFLDSPLGNKVLAGKQQGTVVINISYKDLKTLEIPLLRVDEQKVITEEYEQERSRYVENIRLAEGRWNEVMERLQKTIMNVKQ
ncbi:restriction endonuclease subunit S [Paenibacillus polymyxa]|uniref:restriction endonuclease subunit S n=1 Tax=Paenibacillus polymyxa TaxID=1406 RepID=UPI00083D634C|nr:restriction endonuclease subunit S [Paenibacillus polymyxa]ODB61579.1 restriction endonuclease subunit S [Paenibacillus polymyxa]